MKQYRVLILELILVLGGVAPGGATVKFALAYGASCNLCHVTSSGGGMRNTYGYEEIMLTDLPRPGRGRSPAAEFSTRLTDGIRWGMDTRLQMYNFEATAGRPSGTGIFPMQLAAYLHLQPGKRFDVYLAQYLFQNTAEFWGRLMSDDGTRYVRFGKFLPAYGIRLDDHTSFVRGGNVGRTIVPDMEVQGLPFNPYQHGDGAFEGGIYLGDIHLSLSAMDPFLTISSGDPADWNYSVRGEIIQFIGHLNYMAGASYLQEEELQIAGFFGGACYKALTLLGEVDIADNWADKGVRSLASYGELNAKLGQGKNVFLKYDFFDADIDQLENALTRYTLGAELFPYPFIEIKPQLRWNSGPGENPGTRDLLLQIHIFI